MYQSSLGKLPLYGKPVSADTGEVIQWNAQNATPGSLRTIRVEKSDLPGLLPEGSRCEVMWVNCQQLSAGDIISTCDGKFRRFWACEGKSLWVTNESGLLHEITTPKDGVVAKVLVRPGLLSNLVWMLGASAGRLRRKPRR